MQKLRRHLGLLHGPCAWKRLLENGDSEKQKPLLDSRRTFCGVPMTPFQRMRAISLSTPYMLR